MFKPNARDIEHAIQSCTRDLRSASDTPAIREYIDRNTAIMTNAWNERRRILRYDDHLITCPTYAHFIYKRELYYIIQNYKILESQVKNTC
jgi:hypothetical protein